MTVSEEINQFIEENGGNTRDALNVAMCRIDELKIEVGRLKQMLIAGITEEDIANTAPDEPKFR